MLRGALYVCVFVWVAMACRDAFAHGEPPQAYAILSLDHEGPRAVSLSRGVALRRAAQRYQFVCPGAWQDQFTAPVAALSDGSIVVGARQGLMLLDEQGTLSAHPAPAAVGRSNELVRGPLGVFALRPAATGSEVLSVDAQAVRVIWKDTNTWSSLAVLNDRLVLVRAANRIVELVTIAASDGVEIERQSAVLDAPVDYAFARANAGSAYALVVYRTGLMALGSLVMNAFEKLAEGTLSIAGPLTVANINLLALDGQLFDGTMTLLVGDHNVICLGDYAGLSYACEREGISRLEGLVLGEPLFRFNWLLPPDLTRVPEGEPRMLCNMQWQDLLLDMQLAMLDTSALLSDPTAAATAGAPAPQAGGAAPALVSEPPLVHEPGTGCTVHAGQHKYRSTDAIAAGIALALFVVRCRSRRRRASPQL